MLRVDVGGKLTIMRPLKAVEKMDLATEIVKIIRNEIFTGELRYGTILRQEELAEQLGVSRTPLRDALHLLEAEGVLEKAGRRVRVARYNYHEAKDLYELRERVESLAARQAAERASTKEQEHLGHLLERLLAEAADGNRSEWLEANAEYHESIIRMSHNAWVIRLMPMIRISVRSFLPMLDMNPDRITVSNREHIKLLDAIVGRDGGLAEEITVKHLRITKDLYLKSLKNSL